MSIISQYKWNAVSLDLRLCFVFSFSFVYFHSIKDCAAFLLSIWLNIYFIYYYYYCYYSRWAGTKLKYFDCKSFFVDILSFIKCDGLCMWWSILWQTDKKSSYTKLWLIAAIALRLELEAEKWMNEKNNNEYSVIVRKLKSFLSILKTQFQYYYLMKFDLFYVHASVSKHFFLLFFFFLK